MRISTLDEGWSLDDSIVLSRELKAIGIDVVDCSTGGLGRSPQALRVSRGYGFQVPFAEKIKQEVLTINQSYPMMFALFEGRYGSFYGVKSAAKLLLDYINLVDNRKS